MNQNSEQLACDEIDKQLLVSGWVGTIDQIYSYKLEISLTFSSKQQIFQEIESRFSVCDKVKETIAANLKKAEALREIVLQKKAFDEGLLAE